MTMQLVSVSSKGQIAIPVSYRKALSIKEESQLVIYSDGENIILKPVELPSEDKLSAALAKICRERRAYRRGYQESNPAIQKEPKIITQ